MSDHTWGGDSRYFSARAAQLPSHPIEKAWVAKLNAALPNLRDRVSQTFRQWNLVVRDHLRNETGLRLSVGDQAAAVPVRIEDGLPARLIRTLQDVENLSNLLLQRRQIQAAAKGLEVVASEHELATKLVDATPPEVPKVSVDELQRVREFLKRLSDTIEKVKLAKKLLMIDEDILGAYWFRIPEVHLYWVPIGIVSLLLDCEPEALTAVVLAHELAHAYTHIGRDIDHTPWDTESFAKTDVHIVEGLAQFYTEVVCKKLAVRFPGPIGAFNRLLENQSPPYQLFTHWTEETPNPGELIRAMLIRVRLANVRELGPFGGILEEQRRMLADRAPATGSRS